VVIVKLNGNDMTILNPGAIEIKRPKKSIFKNGMWQINHVDGIITIPCRIDYNTKEELVDKLNQIDTWLKDGFLYVDDHTKYDVRLIIGMTHQNNFTKFKLMFRTDEFKYEVYQYTYMTPINSLYNPLERQN
jgi:hypothetical protein